MCKRLDLRTFACYYCGMKREDLVALSKDELIEIILQLVEVNAALAARVSQLEDQLNKQPTKGKSTPSWVKSNKPKSDPKPSAKQGHPGFGRKREVSLIALE